MRQNMISLSFLTALSVKALELPLTLMDFDEWIC